MTKVFWIVAAMAVSSGAIAAAASPAACCGKAPGTYPTFCAIPPLPTGVRKAEDFKLAVVDVRREGRRVVEQSSPETFGLVSGQTEDFGAEARAQAAWPGAADSVDTAAFAAEARRKATPPPRARR